MSDTGSLVYAVVKGASQPAPPARYPTAREVVQAAIAAHAVSAAAAHPDTSAGMDAGTSGGDPSADTTPHDSKPERFIYPCQDLDGNTHTLFVVPLGRRIAIVGPNGTTAVLEEQAVIDLGGQLDDAFMTDVPGGIMSMGSVDVNATSNLCTLEGTSLEVEVHAYAKQALLHLFSKDGHITVPLGLDVVQKLRQMLDGAERVMLGEVLPERPDDDGKDAGAPEPEQEVRDSFRAATTAAQIENGF